MAALKCSCFASALEHCNKAINIIEFFYNNNYEDQSNEESKDNYLLLRMKTYQRRATARMSLAHYYDAVNDFEKAVKISSMQNIVACTKAEQLDIQKRNEYLKKQLEEAKVALSEHKIEKSIVSDKNDTKLQELKCVESASVQLISLAKDSRIEEKEEQFIDVMRDLFSVVEKAGKSFYETRVEMEESDDGRAKLRTCLRTCGILDLLSNYVVNVYKNRNDLDNALRNDCGIPALPKQRVKSKTANRKNDEGHSLLCYVLKVVKISCETKKNAELVASIPSFLKGVLHICLRYQEASNYANDISFEGFQLINEVLNTGSNTISAQNVTLQVADTIMEDDKLLLKRLSQTLTSIFHSVDDNKPFPVMLEILTTLLNLLSDESARKKLVDETEYIVVETISSLLLGTLNSSVLEERSKKNFSSNAQSLWLLCLKCLKYCAIDAGPRRRIARNGRTMKSLLTVTSNMIKENITVGLTVDAHASDVWLVENLSLIINLIPDENAVSYFNDHDGGLPQRFIDACTLARSDIASSAIIMSKSTLLVSRLARIDEKTRRLIIEDTNSDGDNNLASIIKCGQQFQTKLAEPKYLHKDKSLSVDDYSNDLNDVVDSIIRTMALCTSYSAKAMGIIMEYQGIHLLAAALK